MRMPNPLYFVLMPFGRKSSPIGGIIDFDAVYLQIIKPAIVATALEPIRADEEQGGGIIRKPMLERLILCEYAVTDLTAVNASRRHGLGPRAARAQPRRIGRGGGAGAGKEKNKFTALSCRRTPKGNWSSIPLRTRRTWTSDSNQLVWSRLPNTQSILAWNTTRNDEA